MNRAKTKKKKTKKSSPSLRQQIGNAPVAAKEIIGSIKLAWYQEVHPDAQHRAHHHKIWQRTTIGAAGLFGVAALFVGGVYAFAGGSLAPVYLGSVPIEATESYESVSSKLDKQTKSYKFTIRYPDKTLKSFSLEQAGISIDQQRSIDGAKNSLKASFGERLRWWQPIKLPVAVTKDAAKFQVFVDTYATITKVVPQNAGIKVVDGNVVITPHTEGEGYSLTGRGSTLASTIGTMDTRPMVLTSSKLKPAIYQKDTDKAKQKIEKLLAQSVVLDIAGDTHTASRAEIGSWLDIEPVPSAKTIDVEVDSGRVLEYINRVAEDYTTPVSNRTIINTTSGEIVVDPGSDGSDVVNKNEVASQVSAGLAGGKAISEKLEVKYVKAKTTALPAHAKWILANVTTKRMYAYEGSTLVKSFLISAGAPQTPTVLGRYKVYAKHRSQDMRGLNADGSRYFQPNVPYVLYFTGDYAIHGNYWRPASWFGNVNSSHGCLGVTVGDGAWIYDWAPIGTPVITQS